MGVLASGAQMWVREAMSRAAPLAQVDAGGSSLCGW